MKWWLGLSGGTAYGAVQPPVFCSLIASLGWFSGGTGISVGAINGLPLAEKRIDLPIKEFLRLKSTNDFARKRCNFWRGFRDLQPLEERFYINKCGLNIKIPFEVGMVDVASSRLLRVQLKGMSQKDAIDAVLGSANQPWPIMQPRQFRGRWVMDGGAGGHVLMPPSIYEYDELHVVSCTPIGKDRTIVRTQNQISKPHRQLDTAIDALLTRQLHEDIEDIIEQGIVSGAKVFVYSPPSWDAIGEAFVASPEWIRKRFEIGQWMVKNPTVYKSSSNLKARP